MFITTHRHRHRRRRHHRNQSSYRHHIAVAIGRQSQVKEPVTPKPNMLAITDGSPNTPPPAAAAVRDRNVLSTCGVKLVEASDGFFYLYLADGRRIKASERFEKVELKFDAQGNALLHYPVLKECVIIVSSW